MADACRKVRDEPRAMLHPNSRNARPVKTDVHGLHSQTGDSASADAERSHPKTSFRRSIDDARFAQKRVPAQPDSIVVNHVEDLLAWSADVHAALYRGSPKSQQSCQFGSSALSRVRFLRLRLRARTDLIRFF